MRMMRPGRFFRVTFVAAVALLATGCSTWPKDLNVRLAESEQGPGTPSVDVHLVAVPASKLRQFRTMSVTDYWSPSGQSRSAMPARKELFLGPGATSRTISRNDPIWKQWNAKQRPYLFVLADLRGVAEKEGAADPRRIVLPLDKNRWPGGTKTIRVDVHRDRVELATPFKPRG